MLIAKIFVNERQIDEIHVQQVGFDDKTGKHLYEIKLPRKVKGKLKHKRSTGYKPLLMQVFKKIEKLSTDDFQDEYMKYLLVTIQEKLGIDNAPKSDNNKSNLK